MIPVFLTFSISTRTKLCERNSQALSAPFSQSETLQMIQQVQNLAVYSSSGDSSTNLIIL